MLPSTTFVALCTLLATAFADKPPSYSGFSNKWKDDFAGAKDAIPATSKWNTIATSAVFNNEWQTYTKDKSNVRQTGAGKLQLIPRKDKTTSRWTSGRIESKYTFTPTSGKVTRLEAKLRIAGAPKSQKQGIWPAFWLNGDSYRTNGTKWPLNGEVDIFENVNGDGTCVGVVHCDQNPGGVCNEPIGLPGRTAINGYQMQTWRVDFDLKKSSFKDQTITWYKDGTKFHQVTGKQIGKESIWKTFARSPLYIIINVAVGGDFPGAPNDKTVGGSGNLMEVAYVAHYVST